MGANEKNKRLSVNAINLVITCLFLFFAVQFSDGGGEFAIKINRITASLDKAVSDLNENITYSDFNETSEYFSSGGFNPKAMAGLYNLTNMFIKTIVPEDILMDGIVSVNSQNGILFNIPDTRDTLYYYRKLVALLVFLVVCVVLFPLCGLCFCCCRCCGNCGARPQAADKKKDTCKKIFQGTILIVLGTGLLFCVVCAFVSNQQLQDGIETFPTTARHSLQDTQTFLDTTKQHITYLLKVNYKEFSDAFLKTMADSSEIVTTELNNYSKATAMTELFNFTTHIETVNTSLISLKDSSNKLRVYASQLNDALRKVKRDLFITLEKCDAKKECREVKNNVSTLTTTIDFNGLPDVSSDIENFNTLEIGNIKQAAEEGQKQLDQIEDNIRKALDDGITSATAQIKDTETTIDQNLLSVTDVVDSLKNGINDIASPAVDKAESYITEYAKYRYYVGLAISCVLLLVTICIMLGLICGICGKRPDGYSDNCCNKGAGSQFLLCAVMIMFLFGFVVSVITIVCLIAGVVPDKALCDPIENPDPDKYRIVRLLDSLNLKMDVDIKPSVALNNCYANNSLYNTFNLKTRFDLDEMRTKFDISEQLDKLNFNGSIPKDFQILTEKNRKIIEGLLDFSPSVDLDNFKHELSDHNFTNYSLTDLSYKLEEIISQLESDYAGVKSALQLSVLHLNTYNEKLLVPMQNLAKEVVDNALKLQDDLKMGKSSFHEAIKSLLDEIAYAEKFLKTEGPERLNKVAEVFKQIIILQVNSYLDRVTDHIQDKVGLCAPLSNALKATLNSTCNKIVLPWNGFWFSLLWTVVLYVLVIIVSVKLANLYQKYKPYGQYVETRGGKRGKKKGKKSKRYEERPNVGNEVAREYPAGSRPPDGRYADMAPNYRNNYPNQYGRSQNLYGGLQNPYGRPGENKNYVKSTRF